MPVKNPGKKKNNGHRKIAPRADNGNVLKAHEQAEKDIEKDPELSIGPEKGDDLDEGELAKLDNNV